MPTTHASLGGADDPLKLKGVKFTKGYCSVVWFEELDQFEGAEAYYHDQIVYCDDTPDSKVQMNVWRRELGIRVHAARKARMRRLSYEWLAGLREILIDSERCPLTFSEFTLKEFERDKEGQWIDDIPDGNDHSIDALRYALMDDVLRG